ncbi:MAG: endonuclease/exonuclease/phosphatase family protein [Dongiaceae bacterium]
MLVGTYNIQWGKGLDEKVDLDRIARTIGHADVIGLQEVERYWRALEYPDEVSRLSELLPQFHYVYGVAVDVGGSWVAKDGRVENRRRQYGNLLLSRWPIGATRTLPLSKYPVYGHVNDQSVVTEAIILHPTRPFRVYITHMNFLSRRQRLIQIAEMLRFINDAPNQGGIVVGLGVDDSVYGEDWLAIARDEVPGMPAPAILLGDFNMHVGSPEYDALTGPIDPCYGRLREGGLFADALTVSSMAEDEGWTHPGEDRYGKKRIDHIFVTMDLVGDVRRGWIDYDADGSDHLPVWTEIDLD